MTNEDFLKSITIEGEIWKDVTGYEGYYMVSSKGRIVSLGREARNSTKSTRWIKPSIITLNLMEVRKGYGRFIAHLYKGRRERKAITVHRIVATAFIPNPNKYPCIDHIDGNPLNNDVSNLRWCTNTMNMNNPITIERISRGKKGKFNNWRSKPVVQLNDENELINTFRSSCEAGRNGFQASSVNACCLGKLKHHHNYKWMFLSDYEEFISKSKNS